MAFWGPVVDDRMLWGQVLPAPEMVKQVEQEEEAPVSPVVTKGQ